MILLFLIIVLFMIVGWRLARSFAVPLLIVGSISLIAGLSCLILIAYGPKDLFLRYPAIANILEPYQMALYSFMAFGLGVGVLLGVGAHYLCKKI